MNSIKYVSFLCLLFISVVSRGNSLEIFEDTRLEFRYATGEFINIDHDYSEVNLFAPFARFSNWGLFTDLYGYRFNNGKWGSSVGLGIRKQLDLGILGLNVYYDSRACTKRNFQQVGVGLECFTRYLDFRINGYLPVSRKVISSHHHIFDSIGDGFFAENRRLDYAYDGIDAEIGTSVKYCDFNIYGGVGPYYYSRKDFCNFCGGFSRLEIWWRSIISIEVRASYDKINRGNIQGIFSINLPLGDLFNIHNSCESIFTRPVRRNEIILTDHCCDWKWNW